MNHSGIGNRPVAVTSHFRGISVHYPEAASLVYPNTLALYAVSIKTCPVSLVSIYIALIAYVANHIFVRFNTALLVHDCVDQECISRSHGVRACNLRKIQTGQNT